MRMNLATTFKTAAAGLVLALASGCAGLGGPPAAPEAAVKSRADQRWQLLMAGRLDDAYQLLAPGYRAVKSAAAYREDVKPAVVWLSAEIASVNCENAEVCVAKVKLEAKPLLAPGFGNTKIVSHFDERWILVDGQWWHFPNR